MIDAPRAPVADGARTTTLFRSRRLTSPAALDFALKELRAFRDMRHLPHPPAMATDITDASPCALVVVERHSPATRDRRIWLRVLDNQGRSLFEHDLTPAPGRPPGA